MFFAWFIIKYINPIDLVDKYIKKKYLPNFILFIYLSKENLGKKFKILYIYKVKPYCFSHPTNHLYCGKTLQIIFFINNICLFK